MGRTSRRASVGVSDSVLESLSRRASELSQTSGRGTRGSLGCDGAVLESLLKRSSELSAARRPSESVDSRRGSVWSQSAFGENDASMQEVLSLEAAAENESRTSSASRRRESMEEYRRRRESIQEEEEVEKKDGVGNLRRDSIKEEDEEEMQEEKRESTPDPRKEIVQKDVEEWTSAVDELKGLDLPPSIRRVLNSIASTVSSFHKLAERASSNLNELESLAKQYDSHSAMGKNLASWAEQIMNMRASLQEQLQQQNVPTKKGKVSRWIPAVEHCLVKLGVMTNHVDLWVDQLEGKVSTDEQDEQAPSEPSVTMIKSNPSISKALPDSAGFFDLTKNVSEAVARKDPVEHDDTQEEQKATRLGSICETKQSEENDKDMADGKYMPTRPCSAHSDASSALSDVDSDNAKEELEDDGDPEFLWSMRTSQATKKMMRASLKEANEEEARTFRWYSETQQGKKRPTLDRRPSLAHLSSGTLAVGVQNGESATPSIDARHADRAGGELVSASSVKTRSSFRQDQVQRGSLAAANAAATAAAAVAAAAEEKHKENLGLDLLGTGAGGHSSRSLVSRRNETETNAFRLSVNTPRHSRLNTPRQSISKPGSAGFGGKAGNLDAFGCSGTAVAASTPQSSTSHDPRMSTASKGDGFSSPPSPQRPQKSNRLENTVTAEPCQTGRLTLTSLMSHIAKPSLHQRRHRRPYTENFDFQNNDCSIDGLSAMQRKLRAAILEEDSNTFELCCLLEDTVEEPPPQSSATMPQLPGRGNGAPRHQRAPPLQFGQILPTKQEHARPDVRRNTWTLPTLVSGTRHGRLMGG